MKVLTDHPADPKLIELITCSGLIDFVVNGNYNVRIYSQILWANPDTPSYLKAISETTDSNKRTVVLIVDDYEYKYNYYHKLILFRTSLRASKRRKNEFALPYIWECSTEAFAVSNLSDLPIVGFCGLVNKHRKKIISIFKKSEEVISNLIIRNQFWGGTPHDPNLIHQYEENIKSAQFVLCNRGRGNFSMRFYQSLAFGRIPVLVNTDMSLPFTKDIPWKNIIVFEKSEKKCLEKVKEIHKNGEVQIRQTKCRYIYENYFSKEVALKKLIEEISSNQQNS